MDTQQHLSKVVWQKVKSDLGIPYLAKPKIADISYLQRKVNELLDSIPFEEDEVLESMDKEFVARWAKDLRLPVMDQISASDNNDIRAETISMMSKEELGKWSDEAYELGVLLVKLNYFPQVCNETYIRHYFHSFRFDSEKITAIDEGFRQFERLTTLNISHNKITVLQNLPPQLVELNVYDNLIREVKAGKLPSLKHLGIGYNCLTSLVKLIQAFPGLISLDASYNEICERNTIVKHLPMLKELKLLNLVGNPVNLLPFYRDQCLYYNKSVSNLDDVPIPKILTKKKKKGVEERPLPDILQEYAAQFPSADVLNTVAFQLEILVADNIAGIEVPEDITGEIENYEAIDDKTKQSQFWITYELAGTEYKTAEKLWKTEFQQTEPGKGKCNFDFKITQHLKPSKELRDQLRAGIVFKLWETKPVIIKQDEKAKVEVTPDNKIKQEKRLLGILKLELNEWVNETKEWKKDAYGKYRFFAPELLTRPEFVNPNYFLMNAFNEKERKVLQEVVQKALAEEEKKSAALEEQQQKPKEEKGKKEVKKQPAKKGAKDAGQTVVEIEDIEAPEQPAYVVIEKNYKVGVNGYTSEKNRASQDQSKKKQEGLNKKKEETEEDKQKAKAQKKEQNMKRMEKYFDVIIGGKMSIIVKVKLNGLEAKKPEEEKKETKKAAPGKGKDVKKEAKKK